MHAPSHMHRHAPSHMHALVQPSHMHAPSHMHRHAPSHMHAIVQPPHMHHLLLRCYVDMMAVGNMAEVEAKAMARLVTDMLKEVGSQNVLPSQVKQYTESKQTKTGLTSGQVKEKWDRRLCFQFNRVQQRHLHFSRK